MDYIKEFNLKLQSLDRSKSLETVFKDFLTLSTCSLAQPFYRSPDLEQKYIETINNYSKEQAEEFAKLLALLVSAFEKEFQDFLGEIFVQNNLWTPDKGQFFTPYRISKMMSKLVGYNVKISNKHNVMTLCEPCCGSGGMIIAFAEAALESGINFQERLYVEATDIDELCFKMTYVQLSILGIPAKVIWGDSLSMKVNEVLFTPFYFLADFPSKILTELNTTPVEQEAQKTEIKGAGQLKLFNF